MTSNPASVGLKPFCHACQSIPAHGYCRLKDCPMPHPDNPQCSITAVGEPASVGPAPDGLLPCPFDGEPAVARKAMGDHWIACECCDATSAMRGRLADAIAAWNTRAPHPDREAEPTGGVVEAMRLQRLYLLASDLERFDPWKGSRSKQDADDLRAALEALSVSPPVVEGGLGSFSQAKIPTCSEDIARLLHGEFGRITEKWSDAPKSKWLKTADRICAMIEAARHQPTTPGEQGEEG